MDYIHEIIKRYLKNRYPQNLETKIQQWLCEDKFSEEKNEALFRCWSEIKSDSDSYCSQSSWENISIRLGFRTSAVSWKKYGYTSYRSRVSCLARAVDACVSNKSVSAC